MSEHVALAALIYDKVARYQREAEIERHLPHVPLRTHLAALLRAAADKLEPSQQPYALKPDYITLEAHR